MKTKTTSFIFFLGVILLTSCTLEKRSFMPGWHVEWKHAKNKSEKPVVEPFDHSMVEVTAQLEKDITVSFPTQVTSSVAPKDTSITEEPSDETTAAQPTLHPSAKPSVGFALLSSVFCLAFPMEATALLILGIVLGLVAILMGISALLDIRSPGPKVYTGKKAARTGLILGLLAVVLMAIGLWWLMTVPVVLPL